MTEAEFDTYKSWLIGDYAQDIANNYRLPIQEALTEASKQITITLGQGLLTPNQLFYLIILVDETSKTGIGYLWIEVDQARKRCFIHDIYLHSKNRHQGCGRKTLELLETKMKPAGIGRIGLHVFGNNHIAQDLYTKMGYHEHAEMAG